MTVSYNKIIYNYYNSNRLDMTTLKDKNWPYKFLNGLRKVQPNWESLLDTEVEDLSRLMEIRIYVFRAESELTSLIRVTLCHIVKAIIRIYFPHASSLLSWSFYFSLIWWSLDSWSKTCLGHLHYQNK